MKRKEWQKYSELMTAPPPTVLFRMGGGSGRMGKEAVKLSFGKKVALVLSLFLIILLHF